MADNPPTDHDPAGPPDEDLRWLSTRQAAAYLGITPRTVYKLIDTDQLRAHRFGRVIRIRGRDLDTYIDSARVQPGSLRHLYNTDDVTDGHDASEDDGLEDETAPDNDETVDGNGDDGHH
jgi:excisionase family DNA binding protein